ncbi:hypothetical protein KAI46_12335, partial [bacterium]|nr:hypothetical protein [bacterium]
MRIIAVRLILVKKQKIIFSALLSLGFLFLMAFSGQDAARAGIIDQVNAASAGDTVIITEPHLKPELTWEPTEKLRSEALDIEKSIILKGDLKRRIECVHLNVKADDVTINRFEFSHKQDYCNAAKGGQQDNNSREDRADTYDYRELTASSINNLTVKNCDFKDNNIYYEIWNRPDMDDTINWTLSFQSKTMGGLVRLYECDTVVFTNCTFANASAYKAGLVQIAKCNNVLFEDCTFNTGMGFYDGGLVNITNSSNVSFVNCTFNEGGTKYIASGGLIKIDNCSYISFSDCTLKNGSSRYGGGFHIKDSNVCSLKLCRIENCSTYKIHHFWYEAKHCVELGMDGGGGVILNSSTIDIDNCVFTDNYAMPFQDQTNNFSNRAWYYLGRGGALAIVDTLDVTINSTTFTKNQSYEGGALWSGSADLTIMGCSFSENSADNLWVTSQLFLDAIGAISEVAGMVSDKDAVGLLEKLATTGATIATSGDDLREYLSKETIGSEGGIGGALYALGSDLAIAGSTFSKNSVGRRGGAIYLISSPALNGHAEITTSVFSQNSAAQKGGALMNLQPGVKVDSCLFNDNDAGNMGGAIYSVEEITVSGTELKENQAKIGGAVCANIIQSQHTYRDCIFTDNVAYSGTQEKKGEGGAIYAHGLKSDNIREPRSLIDLYDWLKIKGDPLSDLKPKDNHLQIDGCSFSRNAAYRGGALSLSYLHAECKNSDFTTNGVLDSGGAIYNRDFADLTIGHCNFTDNQADSYGGAIFNEGDNGGKLHINRTLFDGNKVVMKGGAVADCNGKLDIKNSIFTHNSSGILQGSALFFDHSNPAEVINCTLVNNQQFSNIIRAENISIVTLTNNIITSNYTVENVSAQDVVWVGGSIVFPTYNICALAGIGNFEDTTDVMVDALNGDFHLRYDFPWGNLGAVEQGLNSAIDTNLDFDGIPRVIDNDGNGSATVDLGAYEANHVKVTFKDHHPINPLNDHGDVDESGVLDDQPLHQWITRGGKPDYSAVNVITDSGWAHAGWETFTRDKIRQSKYNFYQGETIYATYDHYPTATYDFGNPGYYDDGTNPAQQIWTTLDCNPLAAPLEVNIKTNNGLIFEGWSTTTGGGALIDLPSSVSASTTFYASYKIGPVHLTFSQGYEPAPDPSGDYNYGTRLDLADPTVISVADCNPNGNYLAGFVYGEDDWNPSDQDRVNISNFILDEDVTISGVYSSIFTSGSVSIVTDITKGAINQTEAETNGFLVDPST